MPELRKDPILGRWVIISEERKNRPCVFETHITTTENAGCCPFCPGNESSTPPEILVYKTKQNQNWQVRVVSNKYPALKIECKSELKKEGLYNFIEGVGAHEVIIETPSHTEHPADMEISELDLVFKAYKERILDLKKDPRFKYILIFKNHKTLAGATLEHPHSQLIALPMIPIRVEQEIEGAKKYSVSKNSCAFCDIIEQEKKLGKRIITENENFITLAPFASRFPYETWILPKKHLCHFEQITEQEINRLSRIIKTYMSLLKNLLDDPPFNLMIHTSPLAEAGNSHFHWHIEIFPNLAKAAGFEWGSGFYINSIPPETAAQNLRKGRKP